MADQNSRVIDEGPLHIDETLSVLPPGESVEVHMFPWQQCPVCQPDRWEKIDA